jgi:hypothetical protein
MSSIEFGTGEHPGHQRRHFPAGVGALVRRDRQPLIDQLGQPDGVTARRAATGP